MSIGPNIDPADWEWLKENCAELDGSSGAVALERCSRERPALVPVLREMLAELQEGGETELISWLRPAPQPITCMFGAGDIISERYTVRSYLGRGGMGEVYEVADLHLPERGSVALKTIRSDMAESRDAAIRFEREIRNALHVAHPNVCRIFDLGRHGEPGSQRGPSGEMLYLTMEFLPGNTLSQWLRERDSRNHPVPESEALPLSRQMAAGLAAIHERRIIHRDFKPGNVMLSGFTQKDGSAAIRAVITDFGLSRLNADEMETVTQTGLGAGTPAYMAPEQLTAEGPVTAAVDVYALGVTMHEMLAGRRYEPGAPLTPLSKAGVSPWLVGVIGSCLERETSKRYRDAGEVVDALHAGPAGARSPVWRRWEVVAPAALAVVVGLASLWWNNGAGPPKADPAVVARARTEILNGSWYEASRLLEQALAKAPGDSYAHALLADADDSLELTGKASRAMIRAVADDGLRDASAGERLYIEAVRLKMARDYAGAAGVMQRYYDAASPAARSERAILLARALEAAQRPGEAEKIYNSALPQPAAYASLGALDAKQRRIGKARAEFAAARAKFEKNHAKSALTSLDLAEGAALSSSGFASEAREALGRCGRDAEASGDAWSGLRCRQIMGYVDIGLVKSDADYERLVADLQQTAAEAAQQGFESTAARVHLQIGQALVQQGKRAGAGEHYREARRFAVLAESPRLEAQANYFSAEGHNRSGEFAAAETDARRALAFFVTDRFTGEIVASALELSRALRDQGRYAEALEVLKAQTKISGLDAGENARLRHAIARIYEETENAPAALEALSPVMAAGVAGDDAPYVLLAAGIHARLGDLDAARKLLRELANRHGLLVPWKEELLRLEALVDLYAGDPAKAERRLAGATDAESRTLAGLAEVRLGKANQGQATCAGALGKLPGGAANSTGRLCVLEAMVRKRDAAASQRLYATVGSSWKPQQESIWRAAALMSGIDPKDTEARRRASETLQTLRQAWGEKAFRLYLTRPDVQQQLAQASIHLTK